MTRLQRFQEFMDSHLGVALGYYISQPWALKSGVFTQSPPQAVRTTTESFALALPPRRKLRGPA